MSDLKLEFIALFIASGWSQAELARQLYMTRGGVNGIITGSAVPSESALELLRLKLALNKKLPVLQELKKSGPDYGVGSRLAALPDYERNEVLELFYVVIKQAERRVSYTSKPAASKKPGAGGG